VTFDPAYAFSVLPVILQGAWTTLVATLLGMAVALVLGLGFALAQASPRRALRAAIGFASLFLRGTPLLVQLYFLFYILPLYGVVLPPLVTGVIGLGLQYGAYVGEVYRSGIESIGVGQIEAARVLGLSRHRVWRHVILPQAFARVVPPLGNYMIGMFKSTPYLSAITVNEMLGAAMDEASQSFRYLEPMLIVGAIFTTASYAASRLLARVERGMPVRAG